MISRPFNPVTWNGDWDSFKRRVRATAVMSGLKKALQLGEELASQGSVKIDVTEVESKSLKWLH